MSTPGASVDLMVEARFKAAVNTVAQYIAMRPIMDLCERSTRQPGARLSQQWWEQDDIDLEGVKKRVAEAATYLESDLASDLDAEPGREGESSGASGSSGAE